MAELKGSLTLKKKSSSSIRWRDPNHLQKYTYYAAAARKAGMNGKFAGLFRRNSTQRVCTC